MHENNDTNDTREYNATDATESILYTILMNDLVTVSTNMPSTIYNDVSTTAYVELPQDSENNQRLWNISKTAITSLSEPTAISFNTTRSTTIYTPTTESFDEFGPPEGVEYIFVPLGVVVSVIILSAVVWVLIISRKRKLERLRHRLMPMYNFDPGEEEEDDWETELLDECYNTHQKRQGYRSVDIEENAELFSGH
ncbi:PREDICTED: uncharacterized protein C3orf18-like isoform X1 [Cyphomyrmex costatus]|uniref:uncharacterized protein C3orf18-like isoform X1 n=2 Tax=Cyphomyrmex costatus TaxID=456900 RepID=UPI0008523BC3|nr:PREDICTED: uncharacterized protein C3orf18-like isoform X1 [Cyphomyrmex costatus]XP_018404560.1 PREDICTED: uncharacterized protein C3orf18-like isoform X1 [Cyphomyrmex costatus]